MWCAMMNMPIILGIVHHFQVFFNITLRNCLSSCVLEERFIVSWAHQKELVLITSLVYCCHVFLLALMISCCRYKYIVQSY